MRCKFSGRAAIGIIGPNGDNTRRVGTVVSGFHTGPPGRVNNSTIDLVGSCGALRLASTRNGMDGLSVPRASGMLRCFAMSNAGVSIHPSNARPGVGFCVRIGNRVNYPGYCADTSTRTRGGIRTIHGSLNV